VDQVTHKRSGAAAAKSRRLAPVSKATAAVEPSALLADLRALIQSARQRIATVANSTYTLLCWQVGRRLLGENLQAGRGAYGKQILATASQELTAEFGTGFSYTALTRMARLAEWITDDQILAYPAEGGGPAEGCLGAGAAHRHDPGASLYAAADW
jgi:hypothetical protein